MIVSRSSTGAGTNSALSSVSQWNQDDWNNLFLISPNSLVQELHAEPLDYRQNRQQDGGGWSTEEEEEAFWNTDPNT